VIKILEQENLTLVSQLERAQLRLDRVEREAQKRRDTALNERAWRDKGVTAVLSLAAFGLIAIMLSVLARAMRIPIAIGAVLLGAILLLCALLLAQALSWVAVAAVIGVGLMILMRGVSQ
jgi:hypothetical protein